MSYLFFFISTKKKLKWLKLFFFFTDELTNLRTNNVVKSETEEIKITGISAGLELNQVNADNKKVN